MLDDELSISRFSRYATFATTVPNLRDGNLAVEALLELGKSRNLQGWVLFPTRDELCAAISRHRAALSEIFRVPLPIWDTVRWMWDKRNTYRLAEELEIPIPLTWIPRDVQDLDRIHAAFPLALKPAIKEHFFYATKSKAWGATNRAELHRLFVRASEISGPGEVMIQEIIPGNGDSQFAYCALLAEGTTVASMVACRRRQHPRDFGRASTFVETTELPVLERLAERFLSRINYSGLVEVEFKRDPRDGQFKLLDVNARTWGYHTLGASAGVDFPYLLYLNQVGQGVSPCRGKPGLTWMRLLTDFPTCMLEIFRGQLAITEYFRSLLNFDTEAVFSTEDPLPGLVECLMLPYLMLKRGF